MVSVHNILNTLDTEVACRRKSYFGREVRQLNERREEDALDGKRRAQLSAQDIEGSPITPELGESWGTVIMPPRPNRRSKPRAPQKESVNPQQGNRRPAGKRDWEEFERSDVHPRALRRNDRDPFE